MAYCIRAKEGRIALCENAIIILGSKTEVSEKVYLEDIKCIQWREQGHGFPRNECRIMLKNGRTTIFQNKKYVRLREKLMKYQNEWEIPSD
jgi:hypothetical protein